MGEAVMIRRILALGANLAAVAAVAAFGLAFTYAMTRDRIEEQIRQAQLKAALAVLPAVSSTAGIVERPDLAAAVKEQFPSVEKIFEGSEAGVTAGYAVQVRSRGYGGPVIVAVGVTGEGVVQGVGVIEHKETPGLGSYIADPAWQAQFRGKTKADPLIPKKDIDAVTGATISAKAMTKGVREALAAFAAVPVGGGS